MQRTIIAPTRGIMAGVDIVTVQELLGHKTIAMTKRYSHPTPEHKKRAVELADIDTSSDTSLVMPKTHF